MQFGRPLLLSVALLAACSEAESAATPAAAPAVYSVRVATEAVIPTSTATAEILPNRQANLRAETAGRIVGVYVEAGQRVTETEVLVKLDVGRTASAVDAAQASVEQADARLQQASRELKRTEQLVTSGSLPKQRLDDANDSVRLAKASLDAARAQAKLTRRGLTDAVVRAPFPGTVVERTAEIGEYVAPGSPLLTLADTSRLKARVLLDPREAIDVAVGAPVRASVHARPGEFFEGEVVRVGDVVDPRTRRLPVEIELKQSTRLRPGLVGRFEVETGPVRAAILLPSGAIFERFGQQHVYIIEDGVAQRRAVTVGKIREGQAEISEGIEVGEQVVTSGVARVVDGSAVRVVQPNQAQAADPVEP